MKTGKVKDKQLVKVNYVFDQQDRGIHTYYKQWIRGAESSREIHRELISEREDCYNYENTIQTERCEREGVLPNSTLVWERLLNPKRGREDKMREERGRNVWDVHQNRKSSEKGSKHGELSADSDKSHQP